MKPRRTSHAPTQMSRAHNTTQAMMKIATAPLSSLTDSMVASIARTHRVPVEELQRRLDERRRREAQP